MKAEQYNLFFEIVKVSKEKYPIIKCGKDAQGSSLNIEFAGFIHSGNVNYTQGIINEVNSLHFDQTSENNSFHEYPGCSSEHSAEFFSSPNRASFWNGTTYTDIPIQDFLDILQEWIDFLNSNGFKHRLWKR